MKNNITKKTKGLALGAIILTSTVANATVVATIADGTLPTGTAGSPPTVEREDATGVAAQNISLTSNVITLSSTITLNRLDADPAQGGAYQHGFLLNDFRFLIHPDVSTAFRIHALDNSYNSGNQAHSFAPANKATDFTITLTPNGTNGTGDTYLDVGVSIVEGSNTNTFTYAGDRGGSNDFTTAVLGSTISGFSIFKVDFNEETSGSNNGEYLTSSYQNTELDATAVPEPSSTILSIASLSLLALRRKRG